MDMKIKIGRLRLNNCSLILFLVLSLMSVSCGTDEKKPPIDLTKNKSKDKIEEKKSEKENALVIPYQEEGGVKTIPVKINGVSMDMIYDTGASQICISVHEVLSMAKRGQITDEDFYDDITYSKIADGSTMKNLKVRLREVEIGSGENRLKVYNVDAIVVENPIAPVLLGNNVLESNGSVSRIYTDLEKQAIVIERR